MKCKFCGAEMLEDDRFCTTCGKKREEETVQKPEWVFCTQCGAKLKADSRFCTSCGAKVAGFEDEQQKKEDSKESIVREKKEAEAEVIQEEKEEEKPEKVVAPIEEKQETLTKQPEVEEPEVKEQQNEHVVLKQDQDTPLNDRNVVAAEENKNSNNKENIAIVIVIVVILAVLVTGTIILCRQLWKSTTDNNESTANSVEISTEELTTEAGTEEDLSNVDYDLTQNNVLTFEGSILQSASEGKVIALSTPATFYGADETGANIKVENVANIVLNAESLPEGLLDSISGNTTVKVGGTVTISAGKVYILVDTLQDWDGTDLIAQYGELQDGDYILPYSSDEYLTEEDIEDLSLQEINYAKNEIYARHGRKFDSVELQEYFESKSWYRGTIDAKDFSESELSKIERANVQLLKEREFSIDPKGYQLD